MKQAAFQVCGALRVQRPQKKFTNDFYAVSFRGNSHSPGIAIDETPQSNQPRELFDEELSFYDDNVSQCSRKCMNLICLILAPPVQAGQ